MLSDVRCTNLIFDRVIVERKKIALQQLRVTKQRALNGRVAKKSREKGIAP
jgi:hypothetical protein